MNDKKSLTVKLEVVVHDEAAGDAEGHVVIVLKRHQERVVQELLHAPVFFFFSFERTTHKKDVAAAKSVGTLLAFVLRGCAAAQQNINISAIVRSHHRNKS